MNDGMADLIAARVALAEHAMRQSLSQILYSDGHKEPPPTPPTHWQRFKHRAAMYRQRCTDAWLVLTGKAYIE